jgi:dTDP-4-amino-4,6-dideoxygalactose transaminase
MNFIPIAQPSIGEEEAKAVYDVVKSGWISMGKKVELFESNICDYLNVKNAIVMNNGTSTLHSTLTALSIGPGDEVIVPSLTYISSANVVLYLGAKLVLCDSDPKTYNVNPEHIREKITKNTKAFMTTDMKGLPVDFDAFQALSQETGIPFISDSAESFGSTYKGIKVGSQALVHSFSFFANKNMTTGEGGVVVTNDDLLAKKLRIIRNQGQEGRYNHTWLGNNYRMTDILASIGIEQLKKIDSILDDKVILAKKYNNLFKNHEGIDSPFVPEYVTRPSWYMYSVKVDKGIRDDLIQYLEKNKIETRLSFPPIHVQPLYIKKFGYAKYDYINALDSYNSFLDIPIWSGMDDEIQQYLVNQITNFINN